MTLLMYNWSSDLVAQVEKTATRLVQWHNARSHVLDSIIAQKMGLYHHFAFSDLHYSPVSEEFFFLLTLNKVLLLLLLL